MTHCTFQPSLPFTFCLFVIVPFVMDTDPLSDVEPVGPKPIRKLTEDVVNRIAAAEVSFSCHAWVSKA
jgi:hypothetical protein